MTTGRRGREEEKESGGIEKSKKMKRGEVWKEERGGIKGREGRYERKRING